jgi:hypothetical protein
MAVGAIVGFAAGGLAGALVDHDEVYLLSQGSKNTKRQTIRLLISQQKGDPIQGSREGAGFIGLNLFSTVSWNYGSKLEVGLLRGASCVRK